MISRSTEYVLEGSKWMRKRDLRRDVMMTETQNPGREENGDQRHQGWGGKKG